MTNEETKTVLINCATFIKDGFRYMKEEHQEQFKQAYRMALQALEKQIPKKVIWKFGGDGFPYAYCSACGDSVIRSNYCDKCGQALDWSEDNADNS